MKRIVASLEHFSLEALEMGRGLWLGMSQWGVSVTAYECSIVRTLAPMTVPFPRAVRVETVQIRLRALAHHVCGGDFGSPALAEVGVRAYRRRRAHGVEKCRRAEVQRCWCSARGNSVISR
jgi:hypothetical protein